MASGVIPAIAISGEFSGTTDPNGNVNLSTASRKVLIAQVLDNSGGGQYLLGIPFIFHNGYTYLHVMATNGTTITNKAVKGTYWYVP